MKKSSGSNGHGTLCGDRLLPVSEAQLAAFRQSILEGGSRIGALYSERSKFWKADGGGTVIKVATQESAKAIRLVLQLSRPKVGAQHIAKQATLLDRIV